VRCRCTDAGQPPFNTTILAVKDDPAFLSDPETDRQFSTAIPSTDNWPYIYLEYPVISNLYLQVLGLIGAMIAVVLMVLRKLESRRSTTWIFLSASASA
jgi:hypothetical protein